MTYFVVNKQNKALSQFTPNDLVGCQLSFRKNDAYTFRTIEEAEQFINHIQARASSKYKPAALKLRVSTFATGWMT